MTAFVDASALVAMIAGEADRDAISRSMKGEAELLWSAMSCWETISALRASYRWTVADARREVEATVARLPFRLVPIGDRERVVALDAYDRYGKGSRHRAKLNMGDCFAYACARTNDARLLYKGTDFAQTDLA